MMSLTVYGLPTEKVRLQTIGIQQVAFDYWSRCGGLWLHSTQGTVGSSGGHQFFSHDPLSGGHDGTVWEAIPHDRCKRQKVLCLSSSQGSYSLDELTRGDVVKVESHEPTSALEPVHTIGKDHLIRTWLDGGFAWGSGVGFEVPGFFFFFLILLLLVMIQFMDWGGEWNEPIDDQFTLFQILWCRVKHGKKRFLHGPVGSCT